MAKNKTGDRDERRIEISSYVFLSNFICLKCNQYVLAKIVVKRYNLTDNKKSKPVERQGRKTTGPEAFDGKYGCQLQYRGKCTCGQTYRSALFC